MRGGMGGCLVPCVGRRADQMVALDAHPSHPAGDERTTPGVCALPLRRCSDSARVLVGARRGHSAAHLLGADLGCGVLVAGGDYMMAPETADRDLVTEYEATRSLHVAQSAASAQGGRAGRRSKPMRASAVTRHTAVITAP